MIDTKIGFLVRRCLALLIYVFMAVLVHSDTKGQEEQPWPLFGHLADDPVRGIQWRKNLTAAMAEAKLKDKPVLIIFAVRKLGNPAVDVH